jgi:polyhydroxybutyrate depolymerase
VHGTTDRTVPLGGRAIGNTRQGDVPDALAMWAALGDFGAAEGYTGPANLTCESRSNASGDILDFCTHPGGHSFSTRHVRHAWERLTR